MYNFNLLITHNFKKGDIIKIQSVFTKIVSYPIWHYGVVVGDDDIVHFNLNASEADIRIIRTNMRKFIGSGESIQKCEMSSLHACYSPNEIANRALSKVGSDFGGYDLFTNNCEHFANWCASGECYSNQILTDEGTHDIGSKLAEKYIYEPAIKFCDAGEEFCDKAEKITSGICDAAANFFNSLGL